ncbi:MAG: D-glycero-beta-D-manno-heptose 1-phosphate adenylyltransferase [Candidatus Omnitrophota bacterium]|nr:D-glycero-beta-D-manno-heptose 1-phosphate adenylyltransferase [Candidatus Omnitrophota bacterium]
MKLSAISRQPSAKKIKNLTDLAKILKRLKSAGKKIVFTNGCFDILHVGHVTYLEKARSLGDILVVGLNSDRSVREIKGRGRPINKERDRAKILAGLSFVDYVTIFDEETPEELIRRLEPGVLVKGGDWDISDIVGGNFVRSISGRVVTIPFVNGYSTTDLINKLK